MTTVTQAPGQEPAPARTPRWTRAGAGAGLLVLALSVGSLAGAVWGVLRPGYEVAVHEGQAVVDPTMSPGNVEFASYGWFAILTGALGLILALAAFSNRDGEVSPGTLLWVAVTSCASAFAFFTFGVWSAGVISDQPGHGELVDGAMFHVVPALRPGVGWLSAPFAATLTYWVLAAVAAPEDDSTDTSVEKPLD